MRNLEQYKRLIMTTARVCLTVLLVGMFAVLWRGQYNAIIVRPFRTVGNYLVYGVYAAVIYLFFKLYGAYRVGYAKLLDVLFSQLLALSMANVLMYVQVILIGRELLPLWPFFRVMIGQEVVLVLWSFLTQFIYRTLYPPKQMLLVYGSVDGRSLKNKIDQRPDKFAIRHMISIEAGLDTIFAEAENHYDAIVVADVKSEERNKILKFCFEKGIQAYITPKISDIIMRSASEVHLFDTTLLQAKNLVLSVEQRIIKRIFDLLLSAFSLVLLSPLMLITALCIHLEDGGPVFFRQKRCTKDEKVFDILKFRSMIVNAEKAGEVLPATDRDPRITKVGRIIRACRLDELPQLINVLKGEMSIVGPRPERVEHVAKYTASIPEFTFRSKVKAGLTGYAQIMGKYNTSAYDKLKLDLMYIENYSIFLDIKIVLMTIKILFKKESTEGFKGNDGKES